MKSIKPIMYVYFFCLLMMSFQCDEDDAPILLCDDFVILDNSQYENIETAFYDLVSAEVDEDCLKVVISSSGCYGNSWILSLIDSEAIAESMPSQRYLKLSLVNNETCLAVFSKE